ncbi:Fpg/Nei family DNA glycosylase [Roseivirga sp. BDSF3-8]|uniref:Fpg/Nei family DNA glycosylase n=1 Tax=Roseivirga sp. BDSF3-8 TaxID=3241598 RepID=UPI0035318A42
MPELPEVETFKTYFDATSLHQKISKIETDDPVVLSAPADEIKKAAVGQSFEKTERIGKYLFAHLSSGKVLVFHFGMTGHLRYFKDKEDTPKYTQILFSFQEGFHLSFIIKRKFARLGLADTIEEYRRKKKLGTDATELTPSELGEAFSGRKVAVKTVLMDQSVAAGVGNWIADDVLFQIGMHPEKPANELTKDEVEKVYNKLQDILKLAIEKDAHYSEFPDYYLVNHRSKKAKCPHCGKPLQNIKVGGRSTYFCPARQKPD